MIPVGWKSWFQLFAASPGWSSQSHVYLVSSDGHIPWQLWCSGNKNMHLYTLPIVCGSQQPSQASSESTWRPASRDRNWEFRLNEATLALPRTQRVFEAIESHSCIDYQLPRRQALPGEILKHIYTGIERFRCKKWPMVFKVGVRHDPVFRYDNDLFGYKFERTKWDGMRVVFCTHHSTSAAFAEAAAIQKFKGDPSALYMVTL